MASGPSGHFKSSRSPSKQSVPRDRSQAALAAVARRLVRNLNTPLVIRNPWILAPRTPGVWRIGSANAPMTTPAEVGSHPGFRGVLIAGNHKPVFCGEKARTRAPVCLNWWRSDKLKRLSEADFRRQRALCWGQSCRVNLDRVQPRRPVTGCAPDRGATTPSNYC